MSSFFTTRDECRSKTLEVGAVAIGFFAMTSVLSIAITSVVGLSLPIIAAFTSEETYEEVYSELMWPIIGGVISSVASLEACVITSCLTQFILCGLSMSSSSKVEPEEQSSDNYITDGVTIK